MNSGYARTHVGSMTANVYGLLDVHCNVVWCALLALLPNPRGAHMYSELVGLPSDR